ncbi:K Homology domain type 1 [Penicillium bovifimosum]|uniref:K Homology domain type 1 n=1 Tax=Penicillium bovifimosum TaxID=126998 RepID=A0A9W9KXN1_9EURO|nr:K Homology domain type 1 [Penicillium bovifimosum]KAJ5124541.1 K Homology domain type 1 [Penicillium bovifimosum]
MLIGRGGDTRRGIESKFNVTLDIPKGAGGGGEGKLEMVPTKDAWRNFGLMWVFILFNIAACLSRLVYE